MKTTVIYHSADFDGIFCREIARKFLGNGPDVTFIGWNYGDPQIQLPPYPEKVYILDLSPDCVTDGPFADRVTWIDHHKTAIEKYGEGLSGYRIDGVAACRLAWQWFIQTAFKGLPTKEMFVERMVNEPLAVRLAGEYDIWDKRDPRAELFQHGLRSQELTVEVWTDLLATTPYRASIVEDLLNQGKCLEYAREQEYREVITQQGFDLHFEGLTFLACNSHELDIRSHLFAAGIKPHHEGLLGFTYNGRDWRVSLYGVPGKPDIDLSVIAKKRGGGGHKQACGFRAEVLPWLWPVDFKPEFGRPQ